MEDIKQRIRQAAARNEALLATLAETDHAAPDLEQHIRFLADMEFQVSESDARVVELEALRKKELKDHEKYNNSVMRRFLYKVGGRGEEFVARAAREEREYFDALTAEHRERVANGKLHAQLEAAVAARDELTALLTSHRAAQDELDNLYNSIFAGPSGPSFPEEDEKEQAANAALQEYHDTRTQVECEQQADRLLRSALDQIAQAGAHLHQVLDHRCVDLWSISSVHSIHDVTERNMLSDAAAALAHAGSLVVQASRFSPYVVPDNVPRVNLDMGDLMAEVLFGNVFTDMALHLQVRGALDEMKVMEVAVLQERTGAMSRLDVLGGELRRRQRRLTETREELLEVRMRAFRRVVDEMERGEGEGTMAAAAAAAAAAVAAVAAGEGAGSGRGSMEDGEQQQQHMPRKPTAQQQQQQQQQLDPDDGWWRSGLSGEPS